MVKRFLSTLLHTATKPAPTWALILAILVGFQGPSLAAQVVTIYDNLQGSWTVPQGGSAASAVPITLTNPGSVTTPTAVAIWNDFAAVNGMVFNVPTSSTNGFSFEVNGSSVASISRAGTPSFNQINDVPDANGNLLFAKGAGAFGYLQLGTDSASAVAGVPCSLMFIFNNNASAMQGCVDTSGDTGFAGYSANKNGILTPCNFSSSAGGACAAGEKVGWFIATGSSCTTNSECPSFLSLSGLPYTSSTTWSCAITEIGGGGNFNVVFKMNPSSGSAGTIDEFNGSGSTYTAKVFGWCSGI